MNSRIQSFGTSDTSDTRNILHSESELALPEEAALSLIIKSVSAAHKCGQAINQRSGDIAEFQSRTKLGVSRTSTYELIAAGKLKTVKIGRRRFVAIEALDEFIAGLSA